MRRSMRRTREQRSLCLGEVPELRARQVRRMLQKQGLDPKGPTVVAVETAHGRQVVRLVPDADRHIGARWVIVAPCCGRRRLALFWDEAHRQWGCRRCLDVRSPRDRFRLDPVFVAMRPLLDLKPLRRRLAYWFAPRADRAKYAELERQAVAEVRENLEKLMEIGTDEFDGRTAACKDNNKGGRVESGP
jgi:hypothetical protein